MKRVRFAHLVVVASLFLALVPSIANAAWDTYDLYSHQNEDIVRESPEQLKARMAAKEAAAGSGG